MKTIRRSRTHDASNEQNLGAVAKEDDDNPFRTERLTRLLKRQAQRIQARAVQLVQDQKYDQAEGEVSDGADVLMTLLDFAPDDVELGLQRGFLYKTMAQGYLRDNKPDRAERYLNLAAVVFEGIQEQAADSEASAWDLSVSVHGLGNLYGEWGDLVRAMRTYRQALRINPNLGYAWHDLFSVLWALYRHGVIDVAGLREAKEGLVQTRKGRRGHAEPGLGNDKVRQFEEMLEFLDKTIKDPDKRPTVEE